MVVVECQVIGNARLAGVYVCPAQLLGADLLTRGGLDQRRPAQEDGSRAAHDDCLVAHGGDVRAARRARPHDRRDLGDALGAHARLVVEDAPEVVHVGENLVLHGQERAARIDQVQAGEMVLFGDGLGAQVLLDRDGVVGSALDGGVVGDDQALAARDRADARHDACRRGLVEIHLPGGQGGEFQEGRARVEQAADALAHVELALLGVASLGALTTAASHLGQAVAQFLGQRRVVLPIRLEAVVLWVKLRVNDFHSHALDKVSCSKVDEV